MNEIIWGGVNNSGKLKKVENQKIGYEEIKRVAVKNLNTAQKVELIRTLEESLEKDNEFEAAQDQKTKPIPAYIGIRGIYNPLLARLALKVAQDHNSGTARIVKKNDPELSKVEKFLSTLNESQKKVIVQYIELEKLGKSFIDTPAKDAEVKDAPIPQADGLLIDDEPIQSIDATKAPRLDKLLDGSAKIEAK